MISKDKLHTFNIDYSSPMEMGANYQGSFTSKKLSILDQTKISRRKSELCGGMYMVTDDEGNPTGQGIDSTSEFMANMIAILEVAIISKPQWWDLNNIIDEGLMLKVFEEVMSFENSFRERARGQSQSVGSSGSGEGDSSGQHQKTNASDNAPKVVDQKVLSALDA